MQALGWSAAAWQAAGHTIDPYRDTAVGGHWQINPYAPLRPPVLVAASAPHPAGPREDALRGPSSKARSLPVFLRAGWLR